MNSKIFTPGRIFILFSFVILATASVISFILPPETRSIIPRTEIVIPIVNTSCAVLCLVAVVKTEFYRLQYSILFVQTISTFLTGYETLGVFLYSVLVIKLFIDGNFKRHLKAKIVILVIFGIVLNFALIPFGWPRVALSISVMLFFMGFFFYVYKKLETMLSHLLPPAAVLSSANENLPPPGEKLSLSVFGLSERQIKFVMDYIKNGVSYNALSEKHFVSLSTVKKEMAGVFRIFGVKNKEDLRILLLQYRIAE